MPKLFTKAGVLYADFAARERVIARIERRPLMRECVAGGQHQAIFEGTPEGVAICEKLDAYHQGQRIVALKVMRSFEPVWVEGEGRLHFITAYRYDIQGAIYQYLEGNV